MPKIVDHSKKRYEIAAAACTAISEMGIEKVKLTDIGEKAGCTTGAITHYFANKNEVLLAAMEYAFEDFLKQTDLVSDRTPYSLIDVLSESLPISPHGQELTKVWIALTVRSLSNPILKKNHIRYRHLWTKRIYAELQKAQRLGLVDHKIDLEVESQMIPLVITGICMRSIMNPKNWSKTRQIEFLHHYMDRLVPESPRKAKRDPI